MLKYMMVAPSGASIVDHGIVSEHACCALGPIGTVQRAVLWKCCTAYSSLWDMKTPLC